MKGTDEFVAFIGERERELAEALFGAGASARLARARAGGAAFRLAQGTPGVSTWRIAWRICGSRSRAVRRPHSTIASAIAKLKPSPTGIGTVSERSARPAWLEESHQPCSR
jgi:hypothetical protein